MTPTPTISVLLAVYNTDFVLVKRAIDSVLNQYYQNFELVLIDDGRADEYSVHLLRYAKKHEDKVLFIRHKNCGQPKSIGRGLLNSTGSFVTILDADDEYKPNHLSTCLAQMQFADLIASTTETVVDAEEDYYVPDKYDPLKLVHVDDCVLFATLFGRREVFEAVEFQNIYAADAHFFELAAAQFKVAKLNLRTYIYYRNSHSSICSALKRQAALV
jgi:glycosyltransferase involved in cell wall biosynthesis